jgi:hypothetical protein
MTMNALSTYDLIKEPLLDLLQDIKTGKIQLVDFQRSWCWTEERISEAIASVSLGFPIGAVMLLQRGNPDIKFKYRPIEGVASDNLIEPKGLILDGQQRTTTLWMSLLSNQPVWIDRGKRYKPDQRWYYLDIEKALDYPHTDRVDAIIGLKANKKLQQLAEPTIDCSTTEKEFELGLFPVSEVFNFMQWRSGYWKYWQGNSQKIELIERFEREVIKQFEHYQMGLFVLRPSLPKEAVCYIFEKHNQKQQELTQFNLLTSSFAAEDFNLRFDWQNREKRFAAYRVLRLLKPGDFLQSIALIDSYTQRIEAIEKGSSADKLPSVSMSRNRILNLSQDQYQKWSEPISVGLEKAARFLHEQAIFDADDLPYPMQLVVMAPLFVLLGEGVKVDAIRRLLLQWFYCGAASGTYSRGREGKAAKDLIEVPQWLQGGNVPATVLEAFLTEERLQNLTNSQGSTYRAISALLRREGALDFFSGESINSVQYFDEKIENHHIFPQQWCKSQGIPRTRYNSIVNKTPLKLRTNKFLGGKAPSEYLAKLRKEGMSKKRIDQILFSHLIEPYTLWTDDFDAFFEYRTAALLGLMTEAMGKDTVKTNGFHSKLKRCLMVNQY